MTREEIVNRAKAMCLPGIVIHYKLGMGGMDPTKDEPGRFCDCSGFVAWCIGVSRKTKNPYYMKQNGGWFETTAVYRDAHTQFGFVEVIPRTSAILGDLVVYGDEGKGQGHIGIVSRTDFSGPSKVIHCSKWADVNFMHAVKETDPAVFFRSGAIVCRIADQFLEGINLPKTTWK